MCRVTANIPGTDLAACRSSDRASTTATLYAARDTGLAIYCRIGSERTLQRLPEFAALEPHRGERNRAAKRVRLLAAVAARAGDRNFSPPADCKRSRHEINRSCAPTDTVISVT